MSQPPTNKDERPSKLATLGRWVLALCIGIGGALAIRKIALTLRARSAARLVFTDFRRFEGCMLTSPNIRDHEVNDRVLSLALGSGDPVWPHSCAVHLTHLSREVEDLARDETSAEPVAQAARAMEGALTDASIWTLHIQQGRRSVPAWTTPFIRLRAAVRAYAQQHGQSVLAPELPRNLRIARPSGAIDPPPLMVGLPGGTEADAVDAVATANEFIVLLRDLRSRYSICRIPYEPADSEAVCEALDVRHLGDPRHTAFVPGSVNAHLLLWGTTAQQPPSVVDVATWRTVLSTDGNPDAHGDYWINRSNAFGFHHRPNVLDDPENPGGTSVVSILVTERNTSPLPRLADGGVDFPPNARSELQPRDIPLPTEANVTHSDRALLGVPTGTLALWLNLRMGSQTLIRGIPLGTNGTGDLQVRTLATLPAGRFRTIDRYTRTCSLPEGPSYFLLGDRSGGITYRTTDGVTLTSGPTFSWTLREPTIVACDELGVTMIRHGENAHEVLRCTHEGCEANEPFTFSVATDTEPSIARSEGHTVLADAGGPSGTLRVRVIHPAPAQPALTVSTFGQLTPPARAAVVIAHRATVVVFALGAETFALRSTDHGETFRPVIVSH